MSVVRLGVVGLGAVAQAVYLPLLQRRWDLFELTAVADVSRELRDAVGTRLGVPPERRYASVDDLLAAAEVDAILLLASGSHGRPALAAIKSGVPVFCEKPLASSLAEADALAAAEVAAGRPMLLLGYMKEYDPAVRAAARALDAIGTLRYAEVEVLHPSGGSQLAFAHLRPGPSDVDAATLDALRSADEAAVIAAIGEDVPSDVRLAYTTLLGSLVHDIAVLRQLVGVIDRVDDAVQWQADGDVRSLEIGGWIGAVRTRVHWHYLPDYPAYRETVTLHGDRGTVQLVFPVPYLLNAPTELTVVTSDGGGEQRSVRRQVDEAFEEELVAFVRLVTDKEPAPTGIDEGRIDIQTAQRIARVFARARSVQLGGEAGNEA